MAALFELKPRETKPIETKNRCIKTPIPVPESLPLLREMEALEPDLQMFQPPIVWHHSEDGYKICDPYGNKWIDFSSSILISNAGHGNPVICDAIRKVVDKPMLDAFNFATEERVEAAREFMSVCPIPDAKVFMLNSGSESVEVAFRIMRIAGVKKNPKKKVIITYQNAFHGRTLASTMLGGTPEFKDWITAPDPDIYQAPWPESFDYAWADPESPEYDEDKMFNTFLETIDKNGIDPDEICGVFIESFFAPLCHKMPASYAQKLRKYCDEHDILLGMDEIQIGACRSGKFWCFENYGIIPDMFCCAKGASGSLPISAIYARRELLDVFGPGGHATTHSGAPVVAAAAAANIRYLRDNKMWEAAAERGKIVEARFAEWKKQYPDRIGYCGGIGLGLSIMFANKKTHTAAPEFSFKLLNNCLDRGLLFSTPNNHYSNFRFVPPLNIPIEALNEGLDVFAEALAVTDAEMPKY